jgi:hypothetical protein
MKEKGQVVSLKDHIAVVAIERLCRSGGGCCVLDTREEVLVETRNLCGAQVNDYVIVESDDEARYKANILQLAVSIPGFGLGIILGGFITEKLGAPNFREICAIVLGSLIALAAYTLIKRLGKKTLPRSLEILREGADSGSLVFSGNYGN